MTTYKVVEFDGSVLYEGSVYADAVAAMQGGQMAEIVTSMGARPPRRTFLLDDVGDVLAVVAESMEAEVPATPATPATPAGDADGFDVDRDYLFHAGDDGMEDDLSMVVVPGGVDTLAFAMADASAADAADASVGASPVALVLQVSEAGSVGDMAKSRHAQLAADLEAALGMTMGPDPYSAGVVMGEAGVKRFHASYDAWAARPEFPDACSTVAARIVAENRRDVMVCARDVTMNDDGTMTRGGGLLRMEEAGFKMLLSQVLRATKLHWSRYFGGDDISLVFPRAYQLMAVMPPDLRAAVWNRMVQDAKPGHRLMWRTRQPAGQSMPSVYAVTSETYGVFDGDRVLATIGSALTDAGARGSIMYDARRTDLMANASWHADRVFDVSTGDVMGLSVSFRSNDARSGSITAHASAECGFGRFTYGSELLRMRHVGSGGSMNYKARGALREAVGRARVAFDGFLSDWGHLSGSIDAIDLYGGRHAHGLAVLEAMVDAGAVSVPGMDDDAMKKMLVRAWAADMGGTLTHVARALGRAGQDASLTPEGMDAMERAAGGFVTTVAKAMRGGK